MSVRSRIILHRKRTPGRINFCSTSFLQTMYKEVELNLIC